jgi:taurine---2-oxoglutarate transaminase
MFVAWVYFGRWIWSRIARPKEPMNTMAHKVDGKPLVVDQVAAEMMKNGVAVQPWIGHLVLATPLITELDLAMAMLNFALDISDRFVEV